MHADVALELDDPFHKGIFEELHQDVLRALEEPTTEKESDEHIFFDDSYEYSYEEEETTKFSFDGGVEIEF